MDRQLMSEYKGLGMYHVAEKSTVVVDHDHAVAAGDLAFCMVDGPEATDVVLRDIEDVEGILCARDGSGVRPSCTMVA